MTKQRVTTTVTETTVKQFGVGSSLLTDVIEKTDSPLIHQVIDEMYERKRKAVARARKVQQHYCKGCDMVYGTGKENRGRGCMPAYRMIAVEVEVAA